MEANALTPTQRRALDDLMARARTRPTFRSDIAADLRDQLDTALAPTAARLGPEGISVNKHSLMLVRQCEQQFVDDERRPFAWTAATARGTVVHKALELSMTLSSQKSPFELVDLAVERLVETGGSWGPGTWLEQAPAPDVADLRATASDMVTKLADTFPPLLKHWRPRIESGLSTDLCDQRIRLKGKVDLALGQARGSEARVLILDFKTGQVSDSHVEDLRFYALLETLRVGTPPFRLASWYLDSGTWIAEDVTEDLLWETVRRVIDGVRALVELRVDGREPTMAPSNACAYCSCRETCPGATLWAAAKDGQGLLVPLSPGSGAQPGADPQRPAETRPEEAA